MIMKPIEILRAIYSEWTYSEWAFLGLVAFLSYVSTLLHLKVDPYKMC